MQQIKEKDFDRIIYIGGIWNQKYKNNKWKKVLREKYPEKEIIFFTNIFYWTWQIKKIEKIISSILEVLKNEKKTIIISHSFGGLIGKTVISRLPKENMNQIKLFISIASPHKMFFYQPLNITRIKLKIPKNMPRTPFITFGGYLDPMVPFFMSHIDRKHSINFWVEHTSFYFFESIIHKVLNICIKKRQR